MFQLLPALVLLLLMVLLETPLRPTNLMKKTEKTSLKRKQYVGYALSNLPREGRL